ncbi:MAG: GrpB family protein [bacterium]
MNKPQHEAALTIPIVDHSLGLAHRTVRVVSHDPAWATLYEREAARILETLGPLGVSLVLEHTGSTSVPGLAAKPVLDILAGRDAHGDRALAITALQSAGYVHRGEQGIAGRDFFRRGEPRQFHLHLTTVSSAFWRDHQDFRDYLRTHDETATQYATLKYALAERYPANREAYIDGKTAFVGRVLAMARAEHCRA